MHIASKINAALFSAFACGTFATYAVLQTTIKPRFDAIERDSANMNHQRITEAFRTFTDKLATAAQDYSFWDETYAFMQGENSEDFVTSNLTPEFKAVENLGLNALIFLGTDGVVRWGAAYDLTTQEPLPRIVNEITEFSHNHPVLGGEKPNSERGFIQTSQGLFLVAIAPVLKSDRSGEPRGKVIAAKKLNVDAVKELTNVAFVLEDLPQSYKLLAKSETPTLTTLDDRIETSSVVMSVTGAPLVGLKVTSPRDVSRAGGMAIQSAMMMMALAGLAAMGVLWAYLRHAIVRRIGALKTHFATAGSSGAIRRTEIGSVDDEISDLANSFNGMAEQVNSLRSALAESAYVSGLSEWASGTLHNVRNGLTPISTMTWQVEKLYSGPWLANLKAAAEELAKNDIPDDRRGKLNAYLLGSAGRLLDAAGKTTDFSRRINAASKGVVEMVAQFERYANKKPEVEAVDLLPLLKATAETSVDARGDCIDIVLPAESAIVKSNGVILRQVVANVLIYAVEATAGQPRRGRIEVSIQRTGDGSTRIAIADNGEGVAPERLGEIFQRDVSTRSDRSAGLGLHWCANAVKVLGASISAESAGAGHGATILIDLPSFSLDHKEAA